MSQNPFFGWIDNIKLLDYFLFVVQFINFSLNYFFYPKLFLSVFCNFFQKKGSSNFFTIKITNGICPWSIFFSIFVIIKISSDRFGAYTLTKMFFYFDTLIWSSALNLGFLYLLFLPELIYVLFLTSAGFILIVIWYVLLHVITISSNLSIYTYFDIKSCVRRFYNSRY